jgi:hypothetical protein
MSIRFQQGKKSRKWKTSGALPMGTPAWPLDPLNPRPFHFTHLEKNYQRKICTIGIFFNVSTR